MGITYQELYACEIDMYGGGGGAEACNRGTDAAVRIVHQAYPGGLTPPTQSCPAGPEPPHYRGVTAAAVDAANEQTYLPLDDAEELAIETFALERYDKAHEAWRARYAYCGWAPHDPTKPPAPPPDPPPPPEPPPKKPVSWSPLFKGGTILAAYLIFTKITKRR